MTPLQPRPEHITGLILAGGQGLRMGGRDKGWVDWQGRPLILHVIERLRPQVGALMISANRELPAYQALGYPVIPDDGATAATAQRPDSPTPHQGPLAGLLAGLRAATTPWVALVPCDGPAFPADLVARLASAGTDAVPRVVCRPLQPGVDEGPAPGAPAPEGWGLESVYALVPTALAQDLAATLADGRRGVARWLARHQARPVPFDRPGDALAFRNMNRPDDLGRQDGSSAAKRSD